MLVKELANSLDVSPDTVRYYTRIGLLQPRRATNGYHIYGKSDRTALRFCLRAKHLGFQLADITELIALARNGECPCPSVRTLLQENLKKMRRQINESQQLLARMEEAWESWRAMPDADPTGEEICHLIESVARQDCCVQQDEVMVKEHRRLKS